MSGAARFILAAAGLAAFAATAATTTLPPAVRVNGVEFVLVPAGEFQYTVETNSGHLQPKGPPLYRHVRIWLDDYYIGRYEARASDYERFLNAGVAATLVERMRATQEEHTYRGSAGKDPGCTVRRRGDGSYYRDEPGRDLPATDMSWELADAFARWMGFRLPTEAEWEKAARGGDRRIWPWGDEYPDDTVALFVWSRQCDPAPVDAYPEGVSPYGIYNMAGNVGEYVADWYNTEFDARLRDGNRNPELAAVSTPMPYEGPQKIVKGGRYSNDPRRLAIASRQLATVSVGTWREGVRFALGAAAVRAALQAGTAEAVEER